MGTNLAVAETLDVMGTVQVGSVPLQASPLQPAKVTPGSGCAVSVTGVPYGKSLKHSLPQVMPAGEDVTAPAPDPSLDTWTPIVRSVKLALTDVAAPSVTVQAPLPVHPPLQPLKVELAAGTAVSVTCVSSARLAEQVPGQSMPAAADVTTP